jgi:hypothetical protein
MPTATPLNPDCKECGGTGVINKVVGNIADPSIIGSHMEMSACTACIAFRWNVDVNPVDEPEDESEYISTDGRTPVDHYMRGGLECIDAMKAISTPAEFQAFCRLTAFKYLWRLGEKDNPAKENKKAQDYLRWLAQSLEDNADNRTARERINDALINVQVSNNKKAGSF